MGQGERIEILNHCPLTPSLKRSLIPQGVKRRLNLHFRPNPILVTVSLALILLAIGLVIFFVLIPFVVWGPVYIHIFPEFGPLSLPGIMWLIIAPLAGFMIIKKRLNLHSRPNPFKVAVSLTLILMAGGLVIIWILAYIIQPWVVGSGYHWLASMLWSGMSFLSGFMILVSRETPSEPVKALRRLKCPHCAAVYAYDEQEGIEPGFAKCQNCDREFGPTTDKQASQTSSIVS